MKTQHVLAAVVVVLFLTPVVLSVGTFIFVPLLLLLVAVLPVLVVVGLSTLVLSSARTAPAAARVHVTSLSTAAPLATR